MVHAVSDKRIADDALQRKFLLIKTIFDLRILYYVVSSSAERMHYYPYIIIQEVPIVSNRKTRHYNCRSNMLSPADTF